MQKAAVIGAGIGGLSAAIALQQAGFAVTVYERAPVLEPAGAALSIWGNAMAALDRWGCGDTLRQRATRVNAIILSDTKGRVLIGPVDVSCTDSWLPTRAALQAVLLDKAGVDSVALGSEIDNVVEAGGKVILRAGGEEVVVADIAVMADGIRSGFGAEIAGQPVYAGYGGVVGMGDPVDACRAGGLAIPGGQGEEIWGPRDRFGLFDAGGGRPYWFYMARMAADAPAQLTRNALLARSHAFPERIRHAIEATPETGITPVAVHAKRPPKSLGRGRIICIGDAAHPMEPNQGQGACQAIEDALALGNIASRTAPDAILPTLEKARLRRAGRYVRESALIGRAAHSPRDWERAMVQSMFAMIPQRLDRFQLLSRLEPVDY